MNSFYDELLANLANSWQGMPDKSEENPENTLRALWLFGATNIPRSVHLTADMPLPILDEQAVTRVRKLVNLRISGIPLAYLIKRQTFMGIEMLAGPEAMIARKETEILGSVALGILKYLQSEGRPARVLDLCTGSGNLALALAAYASGCQITGADLSIQALDLAERNAKHLGLADRVQFVHSDLFSSFECGESWDRYDLIVCNPPYISSSRTKTLPREISGFEPSAAFDGGVFGVGILLRLIRSSPRFLHPNSWLCFEIGLGQDIAILHRMDKTASYSHLNTHNDHEGKVRVVTARTNATTTTSTKLGP